MENTSLTTPADKPVLLIERTFEAPRELLWRVNTEAHHLMRWWAPISYRCTSCKVDLRVGGLWRHEMENAEGQGFTLTSLYLELNKPEHLVYRDVPDGYKAGDSLPDPNLVTTIWFDDLGARSATRVEVVFTSIAERDKAVEFGFGNTVAAGNLLLDGYLRSLQMRG